MRPRKRRWPSTAKWCSISRWYGSSVLSSTSVVAAASSASGAAHACRVRAAASVRSGGQASCKRLLQLREQLADAARLDRLDLQPRQAHFQPVHQSANCSPSGRSGGASRATGADSSPSGEAGPHRPTPGAGAEQQRVLEALRLQVAEQVLVGPQPACRRRGRSGPTC